MSQPKRKEETVGREMTGDEALAYVLKEIGVKRVFTSNSIPDFLRERLVQYGLEIDISLSVRDALELADAFARDSGDAGVVISAPGSSLLEGSGIVAQAFSDSVPLLMIGTLRSYRDVGKARVGELRSPDDVSGSLSPFIKFKERVISIEEITVTVEKGYKEALSNRARPALVEIAEELFRLKAYPLSTAEQKPERKTPDKNTVAKVAEVMGNSKLPVIVAGYGVRASNASPQLLELAELLDAPVITTFRAKGVFPASHPLYAGEGLGAFSTDIASKLMIEADSILVLGSRLPQLSTAGWSMKYKGFLMHNNVDGEDIGKVVMPQLPIVADTGLFLKELITTLKQKIKENVKRDVRSEIASGRRIFTMKPHSGLWPYDITRLLQQFRFSRYFVDLSAPTLDLVRLPVESPVWNTSESILEKGIGVAGVLQSNDPGALGITDLAGILKNVGLVQQRAEKAKGTVLILNDGGATYLDTFKSDIPSIGKSGTFVDVDEFLERSVGAITVDTYGGLKDSLERKDSKLKVINVKIDPDYDSIVLLKP
ncbi:3D-(3,5/4)-trihydroxycyclohexane-1,2-dione hydrolase [Metallosphaera sp. J1]|uniref:thiamine pyrophosphate-binding protein n=1 Tax=Metallosphaera javensis (ex Hofmann et al. 2022) TaxID=99938 RepID=UPI001EE09934|nr:thiamine pyrophosphate-binding protein [Metallosphaera javensis (ex Hofmann et al. 2022)]MCG3109393.1 3D-(3,5/4)-trihydroxycyclohexane-1,2-dione hydrolase [Metallosphaera javensis (ex Hofmann et al. 2022)]